MYQYRNYNGWSNSATPIVEGVLLLIRVNNYNSEGGLVGSSCYLTKHKKTHSPLASYGILGGLELGVTPRAEWAGFQH